MNHNQLSEIEAFQTWMGEDGIARSYVQKDAEIDVTDAIKNSNDVNALYRGEKFPLLVNIKEIKSITKEARAYFSVKDRETNITAFAVVINSEVGRIIANFFFKLNKPLIPARMFVDEGKALEWLEQFKTENILTNEK